MNELINALSVSSIQAKEFFLSLPFIALACYIGRSAEPLRLIRAYEDLALRGLSPTIEECLFHAFS
jgi:hypothetical protein